MLEAISEFSSSFIYLRRKYKNILLCVVNDDPSTS